MVTGAAGFIGQNLIWNLREVRDGKNQTRPELEISEIFEIDTGSEDAELEQACREADFVFNLAGVNRPEHKEEFMDGNYGFAAKLLAALKQAGNACPVMLASSIQASLKGRYADSEYGKSKQAGEKLFKSYGRETGAKTLIYRFPNVFGKWCRPNYNSAIATFCHAIANDLEYTVHDRKTELELLYIDDLIGELLDALEGKEHRCEYDGALAREMPDGSYCYVPNTHRVTLGEVVDKLEEFRAFSDTLLMPKMESGSFEKKLYSTYLSYLPEEKTAFPLTPKTDSRGSFTELLKSQACGQFSINVSKPSVIKGEHWHNSKWEIFIVVSGHGLIRQRRIGTDPKTGKEYPVIEYEVCGEELKAVYMLPGYTHSIKNLSETENLVTMMWANEIFAKDRPDTFYEEVGG